MIRGPGITAQKLGELRKEESKYALSPEERSFIEGLPPAKYTKFRSPKEIAGMIIEDAVKGVKSAYRGIERAMDPSVPVTTSELAETAMGAAGMVTLPGIGGKISPNIARIGYRAAKKRVLKGVDARIYDLEDRLAQVKPGSQGAKTLEKKLATAQQARKEFLEGFAAMPRAWTRPTDVARAVHSGSKITRHTFPERAKTGTAMPHGWWIKKGKQAYFNITDPEAATIGHEFLHSVENYIRNIPQAEIVKKTPILQKIWARQKFIDEATEDFNKRFTKRSTRKKRSWMNPTEWVAGHLDDEIIKFYRKHGRRMTTKESAEAVLKWQDKFLEVLGRERPDLYKEFRKKVHKTYTGQKLET